MTGKTCFAVTRCVIENTADDGLSLLLEHKPLILWNSWTGAGLASCLAEGIYEPRELASAAVWPDPACAVPGAVGGSGLRDLSRLDQDEPSHAAFVDKLDDAGDLGEQGVVFAAPDIDAGLDARASLPHDDGTAGHKLSSEGFDSQPLRVGIAPVA